MQALPTPGQRQLEVLGSNKSNHSQSLTYRAGQVIYASQKNSGWRILKGLSVSVGGCPGQSHIFLNIPWECLL